MSTFTQWWNKDQVRRFIWICGREPVLIEQVVDRCRRFVNASVRDRVTFDAESDSHEEIWAQINQFSLDYAGRRLVIVRNAEKIQNWKSLNGLMESIRESIGAHVVFISNDEHQYKTHNGQIVLTEEKTKQLKEPLDIFYIKKSHFDLIVCNSLSVEPKKNNRNHQIDVSDFVRWVQNQIVASENDAEYLITRAGGDLVKIRTTIIKAKIVGKGLSRNLIDALCEESHSEEFTYHLIAQEKRQALLALGSVDAGAYGRILGQLDHTLDILSKLHVANAQMRSVRDVVWRDNIPGFVVKKYWEYARHYDMTKVRHCRKILSASDEVYRAGVKDFMSVMVSLW